MPDISLVCMPFDQLDKPSLGISILTHAAKNHGLDIKSYYPKFWFAEKIGMIEYIFMCNFTEPVDMMGEWTFSEAAFGINSHDNKDYYIEKVLESNPQKLKHMNHLLKKYNIGKYDFVCMLKKIRALANDFIEETAKRILNDNPKIVGCTTMFQQNCASLALLRKIKEKSPNTITVIGGANCEGELGYTILKSFDWIDIVVSGEADLIFPEMCKIVLSQGLDVKQKDMPTGIMCRSFLREKKLDDKLKIPVAIVKSADDFCSPDFSDYFETYNQFKYKRLINPLLVTETSRGCWWGQKQTNRCKFCGLNGSNVTFRTKKSSCVLDELHALYDKYNLNRFFFSDNILDMNYFNTILPELSKCNYSLFWETKSNLKEQHIIALKKAGVKSIQPGIESLDNRSLVAMNKGNVAINNVELLKNCMQNNISVSWNYLIGIPGSTEDWYATPAKLLPLIYHFQPPVGIFNVCFDKFSEYYKEREKYKIKLTPNRIYSYIYPLSKLDLAGISRFFEDTSNSIKENNGTKQLRKGIKDWMTCYNSNERPYLFMSDYNSEINIIDKRPCAVDNEYHLKSLFYKVYKVCQTACVLKTLKSKIEQEFKCTVESYELDKVLTYLIKNRLILYLDGYVLSLAITKL